MPIVYNRLFELMEKKEIKKFDLRKQGIHAVVMDKLIKNENVNMNTIERLCVLLDCQPSDICEYVPDPQKIMLKQTKN